jgi:hypothetical protein
MFQYANIYYIQKGFFELSVRDRAWMVLYIGSAWNCPPSHYFALRERRARQGGICYRRR